MAQRALIVIDVQKDYFPGGVWALPDAERTLPHIGKLIERSRSRGEPVVFIQHVTPTGSPVFAQGTPGMAFATGLDVRTSDPVFQKRHPSSFQETGLPAWIAQEGIGELDICGYMTQMCCDTTTREGYARGLGMRLYSDSTAARELTVDGAKLPHDMVHRVSLGALSRFAKILKHTEG
jgi:nicotinamidase-related amidase